jgi:signal peptidase II
VKVKSIIIAIILILIGIGLDQYTKYLAFKHLEFGKDYDTVPGLFKMTLVKNDGAAFGMFSNQLWFLIIITFVALGVFVYLSKDLNFKENAIFSASFVLIVAGTFGNFIDRVILGFVRDFLTFDFMSFAVFNFADMCLSIGVIFLAIDILFGESGRRWT